MEISIYSRVEIEKIIESKELPKDSLVISFYDPWEKAVDFADFSGEIVSVCCMDIEADELNDYSLTEENFYPEVTEVASAVGKAIAQDKNIICQCEYGQSRSAAIAAAIKQLINGRGVDIFSDDRYYPNKLIYRKTIAELIRLAQKA